MPFECAKWQVGLRFPGCPMSSGFVINMLSEHSYVPWPAAPTALPFPPPSPRRADCKLHKINDRHRHFFFASASASACHTNVQQRVFGEFAGECKVNSLQKFVVQLFAKRRRHMSGQVSLQIAWQLLQLNHLLNGINKAVGTPLPPPLSHCLARLTY